MALKFFKGFGFFAFNKSKRRRRVSFTLYAEEAVEDMQRKNVNHIPTEKTKSHTEKKQDKRRLRFLFTL
jgi:hypothetical protein